MKYLMILLLCISTSFALQAQKNEKQNFEISPQTKVVLKLNYAREITIKKSPDRKVYFQATVSMKDQEGNPMEQYLTWDYQNSDGALKISSELKKDLLKGYSHFSNCKEEGWSSYGNKSLCVEIHYEVLLPEGNPIEINTYSGDINLQGLSGPVFAKSLSGDVDADWNPDKGASFELKSISGEVYEGLGIEVENPKKHPIVGYEVRASYKNGGTALHLESVSGDVFLRKAG